MFDGALCLGVCDKIVPGLLIGALSFGHLPTVFIPAGPMPTGMPNKDKARIRQLFAEGKVGRDALLKSECDSYHSAGTCTFYGTANSNQMLMEVMGLHMPGSAFVSPNTPLRDALTAAATHRLARITSLGKEHIPLARVVDERAIVNGIVGLLATGGSTNHTLHLVAIARAAGIIIDWTDFSELSDVVPLLARIYPNGSADVNHFHAAGGMGFLVRELLHAGLMHAADLGRSVIKTSAVKSEHRVIEAPALVFDGQDDVLEAFAAGELARDVVVVVRYQGPRANGMPELHKLTPALASLQSKGFKVALVTDGRMSGASGTVPAAIHVSPECLHGGPLAKVRDGDIVRLDSLAGTLAVQVSEEEFSRRTVATPVLEGNGFGMGRDLFRIFRANAAAAEEGGGVCVPGAAG
jgi:phosphogluconate dehydratase